jgi:hypothetical protein
MSLLFLEALGAGLILVGIIWWTMFSGRKNGELPDIDAAESSPDSSDKNTH